MGGQGRSGDFGAYFGPFTGSSSYVQGDVMGKDEVKQVAATDHVACKVADFVEEVNRIRAGADPNPEWPRRSLAVHTAMCAFMESANNGGAAVNLQPPKLKVWLTPGCPYVMKVLTFINAAKLKDRVEFIQDSPEERKYLAEKAGKESAAMPAMEERWWAPRSARPARCRRAGWRHCAPARRPEQEEVPGPSPG